MQFTSILLVLLAQTFLITSVPVPNSNGIVDLSIVHLNDFHARFEETNDVGGSCKSDNCIGGFSRIYAAINNILAQKPDSILLNGGDNFQGTLYYNLFKWNVTQYFLNKLPFDAIVLGNHEFDDGIAGVVPFIQNLKAPIVLSNLDDSQEPSIQGLYKKSVVIERSGRKIGIIGVIIKTTNEISRTEGLRFLDESESVNAEAERLVAEENVFTNIILSHSGYAIEQEIAAKATEKSKIGIIVGGHSHSFLYTGEPAPGPDTVKGPYPTIIQRQDGKNVLVVQASAYCRYLGNITVSYDNDGNVLDFSGEPIFLDTDLPQDGGINNDLLPWKEGVDSLGSTILGSTLVTLDRTACRTEECLLGNFVTDAMIYAYTKRGDQNSWTYASLAVFNAGGLRTNIEIGNVTFNDMITAQPFGNTFDVGDIEGKYIKEAFEFCSKEYYYGRPYAEVNLLQISGFHVVFDLSKPEGSRVTSLKVRCKDCTIPIYEDLDLNKTYCLVVPSFVRTGGDGFVSISNNLKNVEIGPLDMDVFTEYLEVKSPIFQEIDGRIQILGMRRKLVTRDLYN